MSRLKISVTGKILLLFLVIAIITIGFSFFIGSPLIEEMGQKGITRSIDLGEKAVQDSSNALEQSAEQQIFSLVQDKAEITNLYFERSEGDLRFIAEAAQKQVSEPLQTGGQSVAIVNGPQNPNASGFLHVAPGVSLNETSEEIRYLSEMDRFCIPLVATNPDLDSIYIGT
ncbi:MAG: hypothetical protein V1862_04325, partial [Methanobacteriota archaeon]